MQKTLQLFHRSKQSPQTVIYGTQNLEINSKFIFLFITAFSHLTTALQLEKNQIAATETL